MPAGSDGPMQAFFKGLSNLIGGLGNQIERIPLWGGVREGNDPLWKNLHRTILNHAIWRILRPGTLMKTSPTHS